MHRPDFPTTTTTGQDYHRVPPTAPAWLRSAKLHVRVASRPGVVLVVNMSRVVHVPVATTADPSTLTLCPSCDIFAPTVNAGPRACHAGTACTYVHADVRGRVTEYMPHERSLAHTYQRLSDGPDGSGDTTTVAVHHNTAGADSRAADVVPPGAILLTRAFSDPGRALVHCAHFTKKGRCDRGSDCLFVHCVASLRGHHHDAHRPPPPSYASSAPGDVASMATNTRHVPPHCLQQAQQPPQHQHHHHHPHHPHHPPHHHHHHQHHHHHPHHPAMVNNAGKRRVSLATMTTIGASVPTSPCSACDVAATTPIRPQRFGGDEGFPELPPPAIGGHTCHKAIAALNSPTIQPASAPARRRRASSFALTTGADRSASSSSGLWQHSPYTAKPYSLGSPPPLLDSPESSFEW